MTTTPAPMSEAMRRTWSIITNDSESLMPEVGSSSRRKSGAMPAARASSSRRELP